MDLNEFIFRDDTANALGAGPEGDDDFAAAEPGSDPVKLGLAVIAGTVLGLASSLGDAAKGL